MLDVAAQNCFTGSESNVRHSGGVRGGWEQLPARGPVGGERSAS